MPGESADGTLPGRGGSCPTTRWSLVLAVGGPGVNSEDALGSLCRIYWPPVYAYARHRGYSPEHAEDLTQGFFAKLLEKHYVDQADRERGKFRTFLLSSFKNYMANEWDRSQTEKRGGGRWFVSLDFTDAERWAKIGALPLDFGGPPIGPRPKQSSPSAGPGPSWIMSWIGCTTRQFVTGTPNDSTV